MHWRRWSVGKSNRVARDGSSVLRVEDEAEAR